MSVSCLKINKVHSAKLHCEAAPEKASEMGKSADSLNVSCSGCFWNTESARTKRYFVE